MGTKDTIKDFIGNVADDAKQAFDELLDRPSTDTASGTAQEATDVAGTAVDTAQGAAANATELATLPGKVEQLTDAVTTLLQALEHMPGVGDAAKGAGDVSGAADVAKGAAKSTRARK